jgi:hypothetical protein
MTTNLVLIEDALRDINVISEVESASAEQGAYALRKLNQMMEAWKENDIDFGWFAQTATTAQAPVPDWAELGVISSLAIACAPKYGASVSPELAVINDAAMSVIERKCINEKTKGSDMSHMPRGAGHRYRHHDITRDA